jgi:hypothetical protein
MGIEHSWAARLPKRLGRLRVGQLLGLLSLIGPLSDLVEGGLSPVAKAAILVAVVAFAALCLALLPPIGTLAGGAGDMIRVLIAEDQDRRRCESPHQAGARRPAGCGRARHGGRDRRLPVSGRRDCPQLPERRDPQGRARNRGEAIEIAREKGWL